jgi:hypothetical protein
MIEKHGHELVDELLDIALITKFNVHPSYWRDLALRHKLCTKATKIVRSQSERTENYWYYGNTLEGERKYQRWETPIGCYRFVLKNGSGKYLLNVSFYQKQLEEWLNETNPNHAESTQN